MCRIRLIELYIFNHFQQLMSKNIYYEMNFKEKDLKVCYLVVYFGTRETYKTLEREDEARRI